MLPPVNNSRGSNNKVAVITATRRAITNSAQAWISPLTLTSLQWARLPDLPYYDCYNVAGVARTEPVTPTSGDSLIRDVNCVKILLKTFGKLEKYLKTSINRICYEEFLKSVDTTFVQTFAPLCSGHPGRTGVVAMAKEQKFPFNLDLSVLDTGSITNILNDIEYHMPLMDSEGEVSELKQVKEFFEDELKLSWRLH
jgi:hypothetical protein